MLLKIEKILTVFVVMAFGGTILPALVANGRLPTGPLDVESTGVTLFFGFVYIVILALLSVRRGLAARVPMVVPALTALMVLAFVSSVWSLVPDVTLRRSVALTFTTLFGVYLGLRYKLEDALSLFAIGLGLLIVLSYLFIFLLPEYGVDHEVHEGAWKGVFFQKNVTGRMVVWFVLSLLWLDWMGKGSKWLLRGSLAMALVLLIMSRSGTGLLSTILVTTVMLSVRLLRVDIRRLMPAAALAGFIVLFVVVATTTNFKDVMYMLGRDTTLTGRTEIWAFGRQALEHNFVLGYGYAAFWYGLNGPASYFTVEWGITSVHNAWLEILLDAGVPGLLLIVMLMGRLLIGGIMVARYSEWREAPWFLAVGLGLLAVSISESLFLERHSLNWVVFVLAVTRVSLLRREALAARRHAAAHAVAAHANAHAQPQHAYAAAPFSAR